MTRIRDVRGSDIPLVAEILSQSEPWMSAGQKKAHLQQILLESTSRYSTFVAEENGMLAGVACFISDEILAAGGCVCFLAVHESRRRQGIGRQLMGFIERRIFQKHGNLYLSVSSSNDSAVRFFGRLGYRKIAEIQDARTDGVAELILHKRAEDRSRRTDHCERVREL